MAALATDLPSSDEALQPAQLRVLKARDDLCTGPGRVDLRLNCEQCGAVAVERFRQPAMTVFHARATAGCACGNELLLVCACGHPRTWTIDRGRGCRASCGGI
jgi:hypothetical protein